MEQRDIGIAGIEVYFPRYYVDQNDLGNIYKKEITFRGIRQSRVWKVYERVRSE